MHIPQAMLQGSICPVTAVISATVITAAIVAVCKSKKQPEISRFALVTALLFAGQMLNFPIASGTSGHLLGGVLAVAMLGLPGGILSTALTVTLQCLLFADGGVDVLGANLLNMAVIGTGCGGIILQMFDRRSNNKLQHYGFIFAASWVSIVLASLAVTFELAIAGTIAFSQVLPSMLGIHMLIGLGEGVITVAACAVLTQNETSATRTVSPSRIIITLLIAAVTVAPFACGFPDGLEWVAGQLSFLKESAPYFAAPMPEYTLPLIKSPLLSQWMATLIGVSLTSLLAGLTAISIKMMSRRIRQPDITPSTFSAEKQ